MTGAHAKYHGQLDRTLRDGYPLVAISDDGWTVVAAGQRDLATQSQHHGLSVADDLVVATG